jgi:hypothetical protein
MIADRGLWRRRVRPLTGDLMNASVLKLVLALAIVAIGVYFGVALIRFSEADDAPGGVVVGGLLIGGALLLGVWTARRKT